MPIYRIYKKTLMFSAGMLYLQQRLLDEIVCLEDAGILERTLEKGSN